jgi:hypothetical protein
MVHKVPRTPPVPWPLNLVVMRTSLVVVSVAFAAAACASHPPPPGGPPDPTAFSRSVCLAEEQQPSQWRLLEHAPADAETLRSIARATFDAGPTASDPTEIWYEAPGRLMICSSAGASLCGHVIWRLRLLEGHWIADGSDLVMCETRRR